MKSFEQTHTCNFFRAHIVNYNKLQILFYVMEDTVGILIGFPVSHELLEITLVARFVLKINTQLLFSPSPLLGYKDFCYREVSKNAFDAFFGPFNSLS